MSLFSRDPREGVPFAPVLNGGLGDFAVPVELYGNVEPNLFHLGGVRGLPAVPQYGYSFGSGGNRRG